VGAIDVAARGIHVQDIAHVIDYNLPDVAETSFIGLDARDAPASVALHRLSS
jgi:superfamily II DNA/RNA helicase